jgi:hypothetical protein
LRRGSIKAFQQTAQAQQQTESGGQRSIFANRLEDGRLRQKLDESLPTWAQRIRERAADIAAAATAAIKAAREIIEAARSRTTRGARYWQTVHPAAKPGSKMAQEAEQEAKQTRKL